MTPGAVTALDALDEEFRTVADLLENCAHETAEALESELWDMRYETNMVQFTETDDGQVLWRARP